MAEVSNRHCLNRAPPITTYQIEEFEPEEEQFYSRPDPFFHEFDSRPYSNTSFFDDYSISFDFGIDLDENLESEYDDPNCSFYGGEDDDEHINFVTDLFKTARVTDDLILELDPGRIEDPGIDFETDSGMIHAFEFGFGPGLGCLQMAGIDSESDSEEFEVNLSFINNGVHDDDSFGISNAYNYHIRENQTEEFEWEEVSERVHYDGRENLNSLIDRVEEITFTSNILSSEDENSMFGDDEGAEVEGTIEWEVLLAVNNLERSFEFENSEEYSDNESDVTVTLTEDHLLSMEYNTLFEQLVENENARRGSPPAAKSVAENLPSMVLTKKEVEENNSAVTCAVCKDEVAIGEKVTKLPCCHLYHGDCILPWLKIRNTCPVCRYELHTDDAGYEKRRSERGGDGTAPLLVDDLEVRYNFEFLS